MTVQVNSVAVDRRWFLTWSTYGTWLPGDQRGFIGEAFDASGKRVDCNQFGTPPAPPNPRLHESFERNLKASPIFLRLPHAEALFGQLQETTEIRGWLLIAVGVMSTHTHVVVGVPGDPDPEKILGDLKAYGSRRLNRDFSKPLSDTWWTCGGSKRKLSDGRAVESAIHYIHQQSNPLLVWSREAGRLDLSQRTR